MAIENNDFMALCRQPQLKTMGAADATNAKEVASVSADAPKLAKQPEQDTLHIKSKEGLTPKQKKGISAAVLTAAGAITAIVLTHGKAAKKVAKELEEKAAKELADKLAKEAAEKAAKETAEKLAKDTAEKAAAKAAKEAEELAAKEAAKKAAKEAADKAAKEAQEKAAAKAAKEAAKETAKNDFKSGLQSVTDEKIDQIANGLNNKSSEIFREAQEQYLKRNGYNAVTISSALEELSPEKLDEYRLLESKINICYKEMAERRTQKITEAIVKQGDKPVVSKRAAGWVTAEEDKALERYYDMYPDNFALRNGVDPSTLHDVTILDEAFKKAPALADDAVVYRAVHGSPDELREITLFKSQQDFVDSIKPGHIINDPSFVSTSTTASSAQFQQFIDPEHGGVVMRINLPKGTKGINGGYDEYLLPRGAQIKVNSIENINGFRIADCNYILPEA